jgi:uncharacterized protein
MDLLSILKGFCRLEQVQGAFILDDHGLVVEQSFNTDLDVGQLVEFVMRLTQIGQGLTDDLGKSPITQQYVEFETTQLTAEQLSNGCVLVILAQTGANLGRVRLEIRKNRVAVESLLS